MPRSAPTAFTQETEAALLCTLEFKAYDTADDANNAGQRTAAQAAQQFRDWDLLTPKAFPSPGGNATYTKAQVDSGYDNRGARTVNLRVVAYVNEGAVALGSKPPTHDGPTYGPTGVYASAVNWNPAWYKYDTTFNAGWSDSEKLAHVVRQGSTGVFILDLDNATLRSEMVEYYLRDAAPADGTKLYYDGLLVDVLGPNNVPIMESNAGGDYTGYTKYSYVTRNRQLAVDVAAATTLAMIPNGLVNGDFYADTATNGEGHTQRLITSGAGDLGMSEQFLRNMNAGFPAWPSNAKLEQEADMVVHAENTLGKGIICCTHLWCDYNTAGAGASDAAKEASRIANSKQWLRYSYGVFLLGANGRSFFSYRDDTPGEPHRTLTYPVDNNGTPTVGRRRQFQSQFFGSDDRWLDRVKLGRGTTTGYTKNATTTSGAAVAGLYKRNFDKGQVWVNNTTTDRLVTILGTSNDRYVEMSSAAEITGGTTQTVPAHSSLILSFKRSLPAPSYTYTATAATGVTAHGATMNATTNDPGVHMVTFVLAGASYSYSGTAPWSYTVTGLTPNTTYSYKATFRNVDNSVTAAQTILFTTPVDAETPTWSDSSPQTTIVYGRIQLDSFFATDDTAVTRYQVTRTGGAGGAVVTNVSPSDAPYFIDTTVAPDTEYTYKIKAYDQVGNASSEVTVVAVSASAPDPPVDPNGGPFAGRAQS
jgi:hypothetical protein